MIEAIFTGQGSVSGNAKDLHYAMCIIRVFSMLWGILFMNFRRASMIATLVATSFTAVPAFATSLNFNDLSEGDSVPAGYGGASWQGGRISSENAVYGLSIEASFASPIVFQGAEMSFSGVTRDRGFKLFYQGSEVYSFAYQYRTENGLFLASSYSGAVDRVVIFDDYEGVAVDNFSFAAAPVPEPESYAMLLAGLGVVAAVSRRRRHP